MMHMGKNLACSVLFVIAVFPAAIAGESSDTGVGSALPPKVRELLIKEMNAVLDATKNILDALVQGQNEIVAKNAQAIHDSFILKQEMTPEDKEALRNSVPEAFITQDQAFHEISARLATAARKGDTAQQQRLFTDMVDACVACHSLYATDRFPAFSTLD